MASSAASMSTISSAAAFRAGQRRSTARRSRAVRPRSLAFFRPPGRPSRPRVETSRRVAPRPDPRRRSRAPSGPSPQG
jgi:hypothetical protein